MKETSFKTLASSICLGGISIVWIGPSGQPQCRASVYGIGGFRLTVPTGPSPSEIAKSVHDDGQGFWK